MLIDGAPTSTVASIQRRPCYSRRQDATYGMHVSNAGDEAPTTEWARYLKEATDRPGWSVARLAREAEVDRTTIFRWIKGGGDRITIESVRRIADAIGDDLDDALRAAGGLPPKEETAEEDEIEFEIRMIQESDLPRRQKDDMIRYARSLQQRQQADRSALRERQRADRRAQIQALMDFARRRGGSDPDPQPAT